MSPLHTAPSDTVRAELGAYDDLIAGLLARRGVKTRKEAEAFLTPSYDTDIGDPMELLNMPKAAARIVRAIADKERITVWSDYDCDGIPGGVILHDFFKKAGANFTNYIPHRHEEGYGVNVLGIETIAKEGTTLVITVDSGITDNDAVARARELGMDVIITDHHLPGVELPEAFAVIDPKQDGETYPFGELCGAGLAWKLVCAVLAHGFPGRETIPEGWEKWLLDMAGLATIADMVPLVGENRVIAKYGLLVMRKSPRVGLQKLCKAARVDQRFLSEDDVAFMLAPRVNAASRMGDPRDALELFITNDEVEAERLAKKLEAANRSRRAAAGAITKAVHERLAPQKLSGEIPNVIALGDPDWRPGLLGLVASGIAEEYQRSVFLWGREGKGILKGSCRGGPGNVHVVELMACAGDTFVEFGGHAASGGFTIAPDAVFSFAERLCAAFAKLPRKKTSDEDTRADAHLSLLEATHALLSKVERLGPFGMGNPKPIFRLRDAVVDEVSWFGKSNEHLRLRLASTQESVGSRSLEGISFYARRELGSMCDALSPGTPATVSVHLERDTFKRGQPVRLRLVSLS